MMTVELRVNGCLIDCYAAINRGQPPYMAPGDDGDLRRYEIQDSARSIIGHVDHARSDGAVELARRVLQHVRDQGEA